MTFDFDAHVRAMRSSGSADMISELYRPLFALERWFFLQHAAENTPVLWRFEHGPNPSPCILAFTDRDKAIACARHLEAAGHALPRLMPAPRDEAVRWMIALPAPLSWACFNFEGPSTSNAPTVNFPLYFDDAKRLLELHGGS
jgi:hypothetical protein